MLLEHLDGYEAAQCIAAGGAVLALGAGGCTAYGVTPVSYTHLTLPTKA